MSQELSDVLLAYADLIEDHTYKKISEKKFKSNFLEKKLKLS